MAGNYPSLNDSNFDLLKKITSNTAEIANEADIPSQPGNSGKLLTTNGTTTAWTTNGTLTSLTSPASTDLTLAGGSSGASLVLEQGAAGIATLTLPGAGTTTFLNIATSQTGTTALTNRLLRLASNASGADATIQFTDATAYNGYIGMLAGNLNFGANTQTPQMSLTTTGNVGIGTTSPSLGKLVVENNGQTQTNVVIGNGGSTNAALTLKGASASSKGWQISANQFVAGALEFTHATTTGGDTYTTPSMVLGNTGDVSIASTTAGSSGAGALVVAGGISAKNLFITAAVAPYDNTNPSIAFTSAGGALGFYSQGNTVYFASTAQRIMGFTSAGLSFSTNGDVTSPNIATDAAGASGFFAPANGGIAYSGGGTERFRIAATTGLATFGGAVTGNSTFSSGVQSTTAGGYKLFDAGGYSVNFRPTAARTYVIEGDASGNDYLTSFTNAGVGKHNLAASGTLAITGAATFGGAVTVGGTTNLATSDTTVKSLTVGPRTTVTGGITGSDTILQVSGYSGDQNWAGALRLCSQDGTSTNVTLIGQGGGLRVGTAGTTRLTIDSAGAATFAGAVTVATGNLIIGTAGNGIDFSATAGTGTSELLNDYEEGTWTPTDGSGAGLTFTVSACRYTKIGRMVSIQGIITYPVTASTANAIFTSFPFSAADNIMVSLIYSDASVVDLTYLSADTTSVYLLTPGVNVMNVTMSGKQLLFSGTYET